MKSLLLSEDVMKKLMTLKLPVKGFSVISMVLSTMSLLGTARPVSAAMAVFTDRTIWTSNTNGPISTETFETAPLGPLFPGTTDIGLFDITIDNNNEGTTLIRANGFINGSREFQGDIESDGTTIITFSFDKPTTAFGGDYSSAITGDRLTVNYGNGQANTINFDDFLSGRGNGFLGVVDTMPFTSITYGVENITIFGEAWRVDDFSVVAVPESSTSTILGSGFALGFGALMKRRYSRKRKKSKQTGAY